MSENLKPVHDEQQKKIKILNVGANGGTSVAHSTRQAMEVKRALSARKQRVTLNALKTMADIEAKNTGRTAATVPKPLERHEYGIEPPKPHQRTVVLKQPLSKDERNKRRRKLKNLARKRKGKH